MDYQVSARKYRPSAFEDVIGQPHVVQTLVNAIGSNRIAQAFLFSGTRGVGKTTVARILAKALNCEQGPTGSPCNNCVNCQEIAQGNSVDVMEIDGASNTSVDDVREIRENVKFTPFRGKYRVYIIDEVHMLSNSAFNALLKTLEEPPPHVVFIFATTEIHKIPATILSRCQHYNFRRITRAEIIARLRHVAQQDGVALEDRSLTALARASEGSMRDALSLLDQAVAFGGKTVAHADLETLLGAVPHELVRALIEAVSAQDSSGALSVLARLLDQGHDVRAYCAEVVEYLRNLLVASVVSNVSELRGLIEGSDEDLRQVTEEARLFTPEQLQDLFSLFTQAEDALRFSAHPRFVVEVAAVRATRLMKRNEAGSNEAVQPPRTVPARVPSSDATARPSSRLRTSPNGPATAVRSSGSTEGQSAGDTGPQERKKDKTGPAIPAQNAENDAAVVSVSEPSVRFNWERLQEEVAASYPNIAPFLEMGRLVGIQGDVITVGFSKQATVARAMLEKDDNMRALGSLCERLAGLAIRVRIVELTEADPPGPTMAQLRAAKEQEQRLVLFDRARAHPMVKQALDIFGGDLVEVRQVEQKEARK